MQIVQQATSSPSTQDETFRLYALEVSGNPITQLVPLARLSDLKFQRIFDLVWQDFWIVQLAHLCQGIVAVSAKKRATLLFSWNSVLRHRMERLLPLGRDWPLTSGASLAELRH